MDYVVERLTGYSCMQVLVFFRNYHVFYYLLEGASDEERKKYFLLKPQDYHYLNQVNTQNTPTEPSQNARIISCSTSSSLPKASTKNMSSTGCDER